MSKPKFADAKSTLLKEQGLFNSSPHRIKDKLFQQFDFFDSRDLIQVKYEMLRRVEKEGLSISQTAQDFGFSRPAFYKAQKEFQNEGLIGLVPKKRGPKGGHKLTTAIMEVVEQAKQNGATSKELVQLVKDQFGIDIHSRSIERALIRQKKKAEM